MAKIGLLKFVYYIYKMCIWRIRSSIERGGDRERRAKDAKAPSQRAFQK